MKPIIVFLLCLVTFAAGAVSPDKLPSDTLVARADRMIARGESRDSALLYLSVVARRYYADPGDTRLHPVAIEAMRHLGNLYLSPYNEYGKAYEYIATGIQIAEERELPEQLPYLYMSMASLWNANDMAGNKGHEKADEYIRRAFDIAAKTHNNDAMPVVAVNMAILGRHDGHFDRQLSVFDHTPIPAATPLLRFAQLYVAATRANRKRDHHEAERLFHEASQSVTRGYYGDRYAVIAAINEAEQREALGDLPGARTLLMKHLAAAKQKGATDVMMTLYGKLTSNYGRAGMDDSAKAYEYEWFVERENLRRQNLPDMAEMQFVNQIGRVNSELRQMSIRRQQREQQMIWLAAGMLIIIVVAMALVHAWRTQRRKARDLYQQNIRLIESEKLRKEQSAISKPKYSGSMLDASMTDELYRRLIEVMDNDESIYTQGFGLDELAELAGFKPRQVSQAINEKTGAGFSQMLADYRIREAAKRLADPAYANQTIEGVANGVGIMSRTTFTRTFKAVTGLTPAEFRRQAQKK